ncbi:MAG: phosphoribosylformylglycinamidine synthase subunit PurL [Sulfobacillus acidophilus]|uniref:Phosphoribosylformylglycinamidine synthase subunit PurL n=1 Tax=Sulfobacillus acidophilus TaxID=53633 RepID=A0A2T2WG90_9FIRM|nr:MAG: phosphoribosylformylglycinamidine synthase subunit PurL [Sulfobacillus acidophilus]
MRAEEVGLSRREYEKIVELMKRPPNDLELGLFGALWSEHCSYKSTKALLAGLPHSGADVVQGPGENAGVVRLSDDVEVAFKVESHNHPSSVEPVQGAATGVGGILRDIIAMGARPVALADMLRFGTDEASQRLRAGVVRGIGLYANAIGIPTVTGDIGFADTYRSNPLVNVLAVGIRAPNHRINASTACPQHYLVLLGQRTGRDGIHGASLLASRDFTHSSEDLRPTVQVGDPFLGKLLMEATLEAVLGGFVAALQDLGAAGLTSAVAELCHSSGVGADLWLDRVPLRQQGLSAYEIMLSETQERMLMAVGAEHLDAVIQICKRWDIPATVIGQATASDDLRLLQDGVEVGCVKPRWLVADAPRRSVARAWWDGLDQSGAHRRVDPPMFSSELLLKVLGHPDVRDRASVYSQYDSMIQTNTVYGPEHEVSVLRVKQQAAGLALAVCGSGRWAALDPYAGASAVVLLALARIAAQGGEPLGLTDGVNAGNPDNQASYEATAALVRGLADAARACQVPITGGNVSLHNETDSQAIWPTLMIGALGRHPHPLRPVGEALPEAGAQLFLINPAPPDWGGSVAAELVSELCTYPHPSLQKAHHVLTTMQHWARREHPGSVRTIGVGGLAATLVRFLAVSRPELGIDIQIAEPGADKTGRFYNEAPLQWVVVVASDQVLALQEYWDRAHIAIVPLGVVTDDATLTVDKRYRWTRSDLLGVWRRS